MTMRDYKPKSAFEAPPQIVNVQFPKKPAPVMRTYKLAPRTIVSVSETDGIGYFHGELPHIFVRINGKWFRLVQGTTMATSNAKDLAILNPFGRTAVVELMRDAEPGTNFTNHYTTQIMQRDFTTYHANVINDVAQDAGNNRKGLAMMVTSGSLRVTLDRSTVYEVKVLPSVAGGFLDLKPADFMPHAFEISHPTGDTFPNFVGMYGGYTSSDLTGWASAAGYDLAGGQRILSNDSGQINVTLEPGMAVFCTKSSGSYARVDVTAMDLGQFPRVLNG